MAQRRLKRQPTQAQIDWTNPLTRGLVSCYTGGREYVKNRVVRINTGVAPRVDSTGTIVDTIVKSTTDRVDLGDVIGQTGPLTLILWINGAGGDDIGGLSSVVGYGDRATVRFCNFVFYTYNGSGWDNCFLNGSSAGNPTAGYPGAGMYKMAAIHDGSTNQFFGEWPGGSGYASAACTPRNSPSPQSLRIGADSENNRSFNGTDPILLVYNGALSRAAAESLRANPWQVLKRPSRLMAFDLPSTPDVTAALTGVEGTGQVGTAAPAVDVALTGNAAAASLGTVAPSSATALTNVIGTGSVGTVAPAAALVLTGNAATGDVGSVVAGADITAALTGTEAATGLGTVAPAAALVLGGVEAAGQVGNLTAGNDVAASLTGVQVTGSVGTLLPEEVVALTGLTATGSVGTVAASIAVVVALTGVEATGAPGTISAGSDVAVGLSGVAAAGQVGALAPSILVDRVLTGVEATAAFGTLVPGIALALTGVSATGEVGDLSTDVPPTQWNYGTIGAESRVYTIPGESRIWRMTP